MATPKDWADAYLAQAREDLKGARLIGARVPSVFAMLLQMVFEKLAKAALLRSGGITVQGVCRTHAAASRMMLVLQRQRGLMAPLGGPQIWRDVLETVPELERAHPQLSQGAQLEYPWESANGTIQWPARDLRIAASLADPTSTRGGRVLSFASLLSQYFDELFPAPL